MEKYVDDYVIPIAENSLDEYKKIADLAGSIWKEHGALEYIECVGDDLDQTEFVFFKQTARAADDETVIFSWIIFESKVLRDQVNQAVLADSRLEEMMKSSSQPFDCKRMAYGGFKVLVNA